MHKVLTLVSIEHVKYIDVLLSRAVINRISFQFHLLLFIFVICFFFIRKECTRRIDLVVALDTSGSAEEYIEAGLQLMKNVIYGLNFAGDRSRVAFVTYGNTASVQFHLRTNPARESLLNAAVAMKSTSTGTNTALALSLVRNSVFTPSNGDRPGDRNVALLITDGHVTSGDASTEARFVRNAGIQLITVGVGPLANKNTLSAIASQPTNQNAFYMENENEVASVSNSLLDLLCA